MKGTAVIEDRLQRLNSPQLHLSETFSVVDAANWLVDAKSWSGSVASDLESFCSTATQSILFRVSGPPWNRRHPLDVLKQFAERLAASKDGDLARAERRSFVAANYASRVIAPIWLMREPSQRFTDLASRLQSLSPVNDSLSANAAYRVAAEVCRQVGRSSGDNALPIASSCYHAAVSCSLAGSVWEWDEECDDFPELEDENAEGRTEDAAREVIHAADGLYADAKFLSPDLTGETECRSYVSGATAKRCEVAAANMRLDLGDFLRDKVIECLDAMLAVPAGERRVKTRPISIGVGALVGEYDPDSAGCLRLEGSRPGEHTWKLSGSDVRPPAEWLCEEDSDPHLPEYRCSWCGEKRLVRWRGGIPR